MFQNEQTPRIIKKIKAIQTYLNKIAFEREQEIEGIILANIAKTSCFFYGDVGTAKTFLIRSSADLMGLRAFDILMSETTKPDAIFGPIDVPALAQGIQRTKYKGYAPDSEILFFDEIFKANSIVLNPLLWLINEKQYRNGDEGIMDCPVRATFAASNEIPSDDVLKAIYDRLLLRYEISYIRNQKNLKSMIRSNLYPEELEQPEHLTLEELDIIYSELKHVHVPEDVMNLAFRIKVQVEQAIGFNSISDRRLARAFQIIQAKALLRNDNKVNVEDLEVLANIFWSLPDQIERVGTIVSSNISVNSADVSNFERIADGIWNKLLKDGNINNGIQGFEGLLGKLEKMASTKKLVEVSEYIKDKLEQAKNLASKRTVFNMIRMPEGDLIRYTIGHQTSILWTPKQLRSVHFHFTRKTSIWTHNGLDTQAKVANKEEEEAKIIEKIQKTLNAEVIIQDF